MGVRTLGTNALSKPNVESDQVDKDYHSLCEALMMVPAVALTSLPRVVATRPAVANVQETVQVELGETEESQSAPRNAALSPAAAARLAQHSAASILQALRQLQ